MIETKFKLAPIELNAVVADGRIHDWEDFLKSSYSTKSIYEDIMEYMDPDSDKWDFEAGDEPEEDSPVAGDFDAAFDQYLQDEFNGKWDKFLENLADTADDLPDVEDFEEVILEDFNEAAEIIADNLRDDAIIINSMIGVGIRGRGFIFAVYSEKELTKEEVVGIKNEMLGQASDGWGEGLEQRDLSDRRSVYEYYVTFNTRYSGGERTICTVEGTKEIPDTVPEGKGEEIKDDSDYKDQLDSFLNMNDDDPYKVSMKYRGGVSKWLSRL